MRCDLCGKKTNGTDLISYGDIDESRLCRSCYDMVSENTVVDNTYKSENELLLGTMPSKNIFSFRSKFSEIVPGRINTIFSNNSFKKLVDMYIYNLINNLPNWKLIYSIIVVLLYSAMLFESRYFILLPDGNLSGRTLVVVFVIVTISACIASVFAFKSAFINNKNKILNIIVLLLLAAALSSSSLYFVSNNMLNFYKSIACEINGVRDKQRQSVFHSANSLYLVNRGIYSVPTKIYRLTELTTLHLQGNQIEHISPEIASMRSLIEFSLSGNHLSSLPKELSLLHIKYLDLTRNQFVNFPEGFRFPRNLESLYLDHNRLISLSNALIDCTSLKHLNLWGNHLSELPETFANFSELESLSLHNNRFTEFPSALLKLKKLTFLGLSNNQINNLPSEVANMTNLKTLHLGGNPIPPEQVSELRKKLPACEITF